MEFCRYDFLEFDGEGELYFDDGFLFGVDLNEAADLIAKKAAGIE